MKVKIINQSKHSIPKYETIFSAGMDVRANLNEPITLEPFQRALIKTGLFIELPQGYECQVRPRSGLAFKNGITVLNSPGTIDANYRGEIGVILINLSNEAPEVRVELMQRTNHRTVPQIFIGDQFIGGFDQLYALEREGKLDGLLA